MLVFIYADNETELTEQRKINLRKEIDKCIEAGCKLFMVSITNDFCIEARNYIAEKKKVNNDLNFDVYYKSLRHTIFADILPRKKIDGLPFMPYIEDNEYDLAKKCDYMICLINEEHIDSYSIFLSYAKKYKNLF